MKNSLLKFAFLFIATSCICGMCSKDDAGSDDNPYNSDSTNTAVEPDLKPDATWLYFDDASSLDYFYPNNKRPQFQKWVATKIDPAYVSSLDTTNNEHFFTWSFENTGDTRFLSNTLNPGGKESLNVFIKNFSGTPGAGTYTSDISKRQLYCWYYVYTSSGALHDSVREEGIIKSTFNITKMKFVQAMGSVVDRYKMTGDATFNVFYWPSGTASTTDIHTLQCKFNNVFIDFHK
jgi:hypothetical protein